MPFLYPCVCAISHSLMDSLSLLLSPYPLSNKNHPKTQQLPTFKASSLLSNTNHHTPQSPLQSSSSSSQPHFSSPHTHSPNSIPNLLLPQNLFVKSCLSFTLIDHFTALPSHAAEVAAPTSVEADAGKINLEAILISIDDFFNRYPFFVAGVTFIWLVVIPLTQEYLRKYKFVSAIDAFRKLRDDPDAQLLDIRDRKNRKLLGSPNLKLLKKDVVQVEFTDGNEDGFVKKVMERFKDPPNTVLCILDSFDGNSMEVAELLFKKGFKEAYAIKGGVRGQQGWMAIQDTLFPPSVHIIKRRKSKDSQNVSTNGNGAVQQNDSSHESAPSPDIPGVENQKTDNGRVKSSAESVPQVKSSSVASSSPYPNYPDLKPPSSPTPSKPR